MISLCELLNRPQAGVHGVIYWSMACRTGPQHMGVASRLPHVLFGDTPEAARSALTSNQTPGLSGALMT